MQMKGFILVAMLAVAAAFDFTDEWEEWKKVIVHVNDFAHALHRISSVPDAQQGLRL